MQLFLSEWHRLPSFSTGGARGALLEGQQNHPKHLVPRGGFSGPDFELAGGLMDEHFNPRNDLRAAFFG
jgi:hypothetical protein